MVLRQQRQEDTSGRTEACERLGLHDMLGNVWEWMDDWYSRYSGGEVTDPRGPATGTRRVVRGGSRHVYADRVRFAIRCSFLPGIRRGTIGFRLVRAG